MEKKRKKKGSVGNDKGVRNGKGQVMTFKDGPKCRWLNDFLGNMSIGIR